MEIRKNISADLLFKGRPGDTRLGQIVTPAWPLPPAGARICIAGAPDDTGVVLNRGRPGAAAAPAEIRRELYRMTSPMEVVDDGWAALIFDAGDVIPADDIVETHSRAQFLIESALNAAETVIALGGGNDFSLPHGRALREVVATQPDSTGTIGIISIDPHLDVRPIENGKPHSGSPYRCLIDGAVINPRNLIEFGTRRNRNCSDHYRYCLQNGVSVREFSQLTEAGFLETFTNDLQSLLARCDAVMLSIDLDCCAGIAGVSAPTVIGFTPDQLCQIAKVAAQFKKVRLFELVECAPALDSTGMAPKVAAEIIYSFMSARLQVS